MACGCASASLTAILLKASFLTICCRSWTTASRSLRPTSTPTPIASSSRVPPSAKSPSSVSLASPAENPPSPPLNPLSSTNSASPVSSLDVHLYPQPARRFNRHLASPCYRPNGLAPTVFRGGAGLFYDRSGPRPTADLLHFNGADLLRFIVPNPSFPVAPTELAGIPTSLVTLDPRLHIPYRVQYGFAVERQITAKSTIGPAPIMTGATNSIFSAQLISPDSLH